MQRAWLYFVFLLSFFIGLEALLKSNEQVFSSLGNKFFVKIELLKNRTNNDFVFVGSSRTQDSIDSEISTKWFKENLDKKLKVFNAGSSKYNFAQFEYFLKKAVETGNAKTYFLELSEATLQDGNLRRTSLNKNEEEVDLGGVETSLQNFFYKNLAIIRLRESLSAKAFFRLIMIWTSEDTVHDLWFRRGVLREIFKSDEEFETVQALQPFSIFNKEAKFKTVSSEEQRLNYKRMSKVLSFLVPEAHQVVYFAPPVRRDHQETICNKGREKAIKKILTDYPSVKVLDYACINFPEYVFKDNRHLNTKGRIFFTQVLMYDLSQMEEMGGNGAF